MADTHHADVTALDLFERELTRAEGRLLARLDSPNKVQHFLTRPMIARLSLVDARSCRAGLLGANKAGLYRPPRRKR